MTAHYAVIILAAGYSSRMGRFKPLLPLGKTTVVEHLVATYRQSGVDVYLVVGHRQEELRAAVRVPDVRIVANPDYPLGMFTGVLAGLRSLEAGYRGVFINPVDIPLVSPATIRKLVAAAGSQPDRVLHPVFRGERGHPPLIPAAAFPAILAGGKNNNLKAILGDCREITTEVRVPDRNILFDLDTPEDYQELLRRTRRRKADRGAAGNGG
jgi:molybdenum cofactor cytidylyltransferase